MTDFFSYLERGEVRPALVRRDDEDVAVLVPVFRAVARRAVADREARDERLEEGVLLLEAVHLRHGVLPALGLELIKVS